MYRSKFLVALRLLVLSVLLCFVLASTALAAEWVKIGRTKDGDMFFVDKSFIELLKLTHVNIIKTRVKQILSSEARRELSDILENLAKRAKKVSFSTGKIETEDSEWTIRLKGDFDISHIVSLEYLNYEDYSYLIVEEKLYTSEGKEVCAIKYKIPSPLKKEAFDYVSYDSVAAAIIDYCVENLKERGKL